MGRNPQRGIIRLENYISSHILLPAKFGLAVQHILLYQTNQPTVYCLLKLNYTYLSGVSNSAINRCFRR